MPPLDAPPTSPEPVGPAYWRSLDHLADTEEFRAFMHREFPAGASELLDSRDRRHFLKIMGASMALAGLGIAGCRRWPQQQIVPFAHRPAGRDPGVPVHYATCYERSGVGQGVLATAYDGRPIKIEGNPDHPTSRGAADAFAQASVLDLYDVDRSRRVMNDGAPSDWAAFFAWADEHFRHARDKRGHGLALLTQATSSPTFAGLRRRFQERYPNAKWVEYEPLNDDAELEGAKLAFGQPYRPLLDLARARTIVCLDADLLGTHPNAVENIRGFARGRHAHGRGTTMNRLYAFESEFTLTGANADDRTPVRTSDVAVIAAWLAGRLVRDPSLTGVEKDPTAAAVLTDRVRSTLEHVVRDLQAHPSEGLVVAGPRQPAEVHLLAHLMNAALGAVGTTVRYAPIEKERGHVAALRELVGGKVETLVILGANPVYDAPADLGFGAWLEGIANSVHLGDYQDETAARCTWHLNRAHYLETWGDARAWDGTYSVAQPLIEPLFQGRSAIEVLASICADPLRTGQELVRRHFSEMFSADEALWRKTLRDGMLPGSGATAETPAAKRAALAAAVDALRRRWTAGSEGWEIVFAPDPTIYDGRYANNGWLQEVPDPLTKLTWDNAVLLGHEAATSLGVGTGDMVRVSAGADGTAVEAAVMVLPGIPARSAILPLGFGRAFPGRICTGAGFDVYPLRTADTMGFRTGATLEATSGSYVLATTQDHHTIDVDTVGGRGVQRRLPSLFREAELDEYLEHPDFAAHRTHVVHRLSLWDEKNLEGADYRWAMSVDLNACVGCGACIVACQAENNIPIVGKEQVKAGREMHWMRVDRYFRFGRNGDHYDPTDVEAVALQPVLCMQCENAPCEQVCPVAATVHDEDGLNVMVYNRCVGTRYCSNNCPYKVRRFNYFDWHRRKPYRKKSGLLRVDETYFERPQATPDELKRLQLNPEVTVRMRGVMEKCTYCVQRINEAKIKAKNAFVQQPEAVKQAHTGRVPVADGAITPACAQTCPAEALVFGDLNDRESRVAQLHRDPRSYQMLEELNVDARTRYLAKVRNPAEPRGGGGEEGGHGETHGARPTEGTSHS